MSAVKEDLFSFIGRMTEAMRAEFPSMFDRCLGSNWEISTSARKVTRKHIPQLDFVQLLSLVSSQWSNVTFAKYFTPKGPMLKWIDRACVIRHKVAHQTPFSDNEIARSISTLKQLASALRLEYRMNMVPKTPKSISSTPSPHSSSSSSSPSSSVAVADMPQGSAVKPSNATPSFIADAESVSSNKMKKENQKQMASASADELAKAKAAEEAANLHFARGQYTEANHIYTTALDATSNISDVDIRTKAAITLHLKRGQCCLKLKEYDLAREDAEDALELQQNGEGFFLLGCSLFELKQFSQAKDAFTSGLHVDPKHYEMKLKLRDCGAVLSSIKTADPLSNPLAGSNAILQAQMNVMHEVTPMHAQYLTDAEARTHMKMMLKTTPLVLQAHMLRQSGNLPEALKKYEAAASQGHPEALYNAALIRGNPTFAGLTNPVLAFEMMEKAANMAGTLMMRDQPYYNMGVPEAQTGMGVWYRDGGIVDIDLVRSRKWFLKAAQNNQPSACNNLGLYFLNGTGGEKNDELARHWLEKAVKFGLIQARYNLAMMLKEGQGGPKDLQRARKLLEESAADGDDTAVSTLSRWEAAGIFTGAPDLLKSRDLLESQAGKGHVDAMMEIADRLLHGHDGYPRDEVMARGWWRKAASLKHAPAMLLLGKNLLLDGDKTTGIKFIEMAADMGLAKAQIAMGFVYSSGMNDIPVDLEKARKWLRRCANQESEEKTAALKMIQTLEKRSGSDWASDIEQMQKDPKLQDIQKHLFQLLKSKPPTPHTNLMNWNKSDFEAAIQRCTDLAEKGSGTAKEYFVALSCYNEAVKLSCAGKDEECVDSLARVHDHVDYFRECTDNFHFSYVLRESIKAVLHKDPSNANAVACQILFPPPERASNQSRLETVHAALKKYPRDFRLLFLQGCNLGFLNDWENAAAHFQRCLAEPACSPTTRSGALYLLAVSYFQRSQVMEATFAFINFLRDIDADGRKISEAFYQLAVIFAEDLHTKRHTCTRIDHLRQIRAFYQRGEAAKHSLLPIFPPVSDDFPARKEIIFTLKLIDTDADCDAIETCFVCGSIQDLKACSRCLSSKYCGLLCQKANWKRHKLSCKSTI